MPCESGPYYPSRMEIERADALEVADEVTQLLCCLCGELVNAKVFDAYATNKLAAWWKSHRAFDYERVLDNMKLMLENSCVLTDDKRGVDTTGDECTVVERLANRFISLAEAIHPVSSWHMNWFREMARTAVKQFGSEEERKEKAKKAALSRLSRKDKKILGIRE